jgi:anti-sigma B factor antagonist
LNSPPPTMTLTVVQAGTSAVVVEVVGDIDLHTAPQLQAAVEAEFARPDAEQVIVDLTGVRFLGSSGLGVLADLAARAPSAGPGQSPVTLRAVAPAGHYPITRPWDAIGMRNVLPLHPHVAAALDEHRPT